MVLMVEQHLGVCYPLSIVCVELATHAEAEFRHEFHSPYLITCIIWNQSTGNHSTLWNVWSKLARESAWYATDSQRGEPDHTEFPLWEILYYHELTSSGISSRLRPTYLTRQVPKGLRPVHVLRPLILYYLERYRKWNHD